MNKTMQCNSIVFFINREKVRFVLDLSSNELPYQPSVANMTHLPWTHTRSVFLVHSTHSYPPHLTNRDDHLDQNRPCFFTPWDKVQLIVQNDLKLLQSLIKLLNIPSLDNHSAVRQGSCWCWGACDQAAGRSCSGMGQRCWPGTFDNNSRQ